jgi:hypothetical protein
LCLPHAVAMETCSSNVLGQMAGVLDTAPREVQCCAVAQFGVGKEVRKL